MDKIKDILKRKIHYIHYNANEGNYLTLELEFIEFVFSESELREIIRKIVLNNRISRDILQDWFNAYVTVESVKADDLKLPSFYDKEIENNFELLKSYKKLFQDEVKKIKIGNIKSLDTYNLVSKKETFSALKKLHIDIIQEIDLMSLRSEKIFENNPEFRFDEEKSILFINGKEVKFRRFTEQYHSLRVMFQNRKDLEKEWFYSELADNIDKVKGYTDKNFHNYFSAIKRRIASETGIKDFFITTTQSARINPDYLKS